MSNLELEFGPRAGGSASRGGGFYHASFRSGSRAGGACARSSHDYIAREGEFDGPDRDAAVHTESGHMPSWAEGDARSYWDAADLHERANGRLYVAGDIALPRGLELEDQIDIAREIVGELTDRKKLPYTFAIHAGVDDDGHEHNPHLHVMISERQNDGIERSRQDWFKRANSDHPERGGAAKTREFHGRAWMEEARAGLAEAINQKLEERGRTERVDYRSYERQGIDREPGQHFGPQASHMAQKGNGSDRLEDAAQDRDFPEALATVDRQIERLEKLRETIERGDDSRDVDSRYQPSAGSYSRDDDSRGR